MNSVTSSSLNQCLNPIPLCAGKDDWSHRVFITTNEKMQDKTLSILSRQPLVGNTMIGTSCFFTLNAAAVRGTACSSTTAKLENIILIDRSVRVEHFWKEVQGIIATSNHRLDVFDKVVVLVDSEKQRYYGGDRDYSENDALQCNVLRFAEEVKGGQSWLSSDEKFTKIKTIFDSGHFVFKRMDFGDSQAFMSMSQILKSEGMNVDTVYLSNTYEYMESEVEQRAFIASVEQVISPKTLVVLTRARGCNNCDSLEQCIKKTNGAKVADFFPVRPEAKCQHEEKTVGNLNSIPIDPSTIPSEILSQLTPEMLASLVQGKLQIAYK